MVSSKMIVLGEGDLATAMRASMAIPGGFAPVIMDKMILSDGGLVRNIPVDIARNLCADQVIVVNLVEPDANPLKLQGATQLLSRAMDVMIIANEELQLSSLKPGDVRIDVIMGDITTADFERVPETVPLGIDAARRMSAELSKYSVPEAQYVAWRTSVTQSQKMEGQLAGVRYEGTQTRQSRLPCPAATGAARRPARHRDDQRGGATHLRAAGLRIRELSPRRRSWLTDTHVAATRKEDWA
jgi:NTE family protein